MKQVLRKILEIVGNRLPDAAWRGVLMVFLENKRLVDRFVALYLITGCVATQFSP
jgi:hypothetical protein